ncbi:hypothetical protein BegalDRAFT_0750 [Beggiatoa alba B18LD]|uniref:Uncharacterized protein n=1 Tax=Beggiatoa alba B18LD TaxID=395493 RepID=I3CDG9_9GAMM|nr:hypothetical protein [Beggiatoa alba]EIJ41662.1 hypothetical protein BegalDRAFT_0750 [Beggiatoa alba B18LD]
MNNRRLLDIFHEFATNSTVTIETDLKETGQQGQVYASQFRTIIHLDGDVLCIVPSPDLYPNDKEWLSLIDKYADKHSFEVNQLLQQLKHYQDFSKNFIAILGYLLGSVTWLSVWVMHYQTLLRWLFPFIYQKYQLHPFLIGFYLGFASILIIFSFVFMLWLGKTLIRLARVLLIRYISRKLSTFIHFD